MKRVIIAGAQSYIGETLRAYLQQEGERFDVRMLATVGLEPEPEIFRDTDAVFCVAGIAHVRETAENRHLFYEVNRDLAVKMARAAKTAGVRQFILMSTMSVYGSATGSISKRSEPHPINAYGESKLQAEQEIDKLTDDTFRLAILRPPMVYGNGCKGNYQRLRAFALKSPVFPRYRNRRSMIFIGNFCEFVKECIEQEKSGLFLPQNSEYTDTSRMVELIARAHGKRIRLTGAFNWAIRLMQLGAVKKVFGDLYYEKEDTVGRYGFEESVRLTENA